MHGVSGLMLNHCHGGNNLLFWTKL